MKYYLQSHPSSQCRFMVICTYLSAAVPVAWLWEGCASPPANLWQHIFPALVPTPAGLQQTSEHRMYFTTPQPSQQLHFTWTAPRENVCVVLKIFESTCRHIEFCKILVVQTGLWDTWTYPQTQKNILHPSGSLSWCLLCSSQQEGFCSTQQQKNVNCKESWILKYFA